MNKNYIKLKNFEIALALTLIFWHDNKRSTISLSPCLNATHNIGILTSKIKFDLILFYEISFKILI